MELADGEAMAATEDNGVAEPDGAAREHDLRALPPRQQRRVILGLLRSGESDVEIGARYALSQWQVRNLRYRLGLKKDRGGRVPGRAASRRDAPREMEAAPAPVPPEEVAAPRTRRLPRVPEGDESERMGFRLAGRFESAEAGRRLSALGDLLCASDGRYEVRVAVRQIDAGMA